MKRLIAIAAALTVLGAMHAFASMSWDTPVGTVGLPLTATEALIGYDAILKQAIAGASVPVYTSPKNLVTAQIGAVAPWPTNGSTIEPYVAAGHDILRDIPALANYQSAHLNVFGRYATSQGKAGLGVSFSYAPGGSVQPQVTPTPLVSATSPLNLYTTLAGAKKRNAGGGGGDEAKKKGNGGGGDEVRTAS